MASSSKSAPAAAAVPTVVLTGRSAIWRWRKSEIIEYLAKKDYAIPSKATVEELRAIVLRDFPKEDRPVDPMVVISRMNKTEMLAKALEFNLKLPKSTIKGEILAAIRVAMEARRQAKHSSSSSPNQSPSSPSNPESESESETHANKMQTGVTGCRRPHP